MASPPIYQAASEGQVTLQKGAQSPNAAPPAFKKCEKNTKQCHVDAPLSNLENRCLHHTQTGQEQYGLCFDAGPVPFEWQV